MTGYGWIIWAVLAVVGAGFLVWTYDGIYRRSGRSLTWWLLALRGAGILLLLVMLAKPTWTRERDDVEPGRVAVVVDTSRSMSLPDGSGTRYAKAKEAAEELKRKLGERTKEGRLEVDLFDITGA